MQTVAIEVVSERQPHPTRRAYALPVKIGRGANCDIQLDPDNRAISRIHVEIVDEGGRTVIYNRASNVNATMFLGRSLRPNERVEVTAGDQIKIFDYQFKFMEPAEIGLVFTSRRDLKAYAEYHLVPGGAILATADSDRLAVEPVPNLKAMDTSKLGAKLSLLFYYDADEPTFAVLANPDNTQVMLDRGLVQQQALYLRALDTIEIGDYRIEVLKVGEPAIVCANFSCQVLNEYDRSENCRLCGTRLFGDTRTLKVRNI
jgi:FHA domain